MVKDDSFQIIYEEFINSQNKVIDTGEIIFASLFTKYRFTVYKYEYEKNKIDYFDENGKYKKIFNENSLMEHVYLHHMEKESIQF